MPKPLTQEAQTTLDHLQKLELPPGWVCQQGCGSAHFDILDYKGFRRVQIVGRQLLLHTGAAIIRVRDQDDIFFTGRGWRERMMKSVQGAIPELLDGMFAVRGVDSSRLMRNNRC